MTIVLMRQQDICLAFVDEEWTVDVIMLLTKPTGRKRFLQTSSNDLLYQEVKLIKPAPNAIETSPAGLIKVSHCTLQSPSHVFSAIGSHWKQLFLPISPHIAVRTSLTVLKNSNTVCESWTWNASKFKLICFALTVANRWTSMNESP